MKIVSMVLSVALATIILTPRHAMSEYRDFTIAEKEPVKKTPKMIDDELNAIRKAPSVDDFMRAGQDIESMSVAQNEERRVKLELWLKAIDALDQVIDPAFDPNDVPQINVAPPVGIALDAGVAPSEIKDDKVRGQYEAAIRANAEKAERYRLQKRVRELVQNWSIRVSAYISSQFISKGRDMDEVNRLIETHLSSKARKEQLKAHLQPKRAR